MCVCLQSTDAMTKDIMEPQQYIYIYLHEYTCVRRIISILFDSETLTGSAFRHHRTRAFVDGNLRSNFPRNTAVDGSDTYTGARTCVRVRVQTYIPYVRFLIGENSHGISSFLNLLAHAHIHDPFDQSSIYNIYAYTGHVE